MKDLTKLSLLALTILVGITLVSSTYCPKEYTVKRLKFVNISYRCGWWFWRRTCYRRKCVYYTETLVNKYVCCSGWKGCYCNIPICNPPCLNKGVCLRPGVCSCPSGYGDITCGTRTCSALTDCYPGTCDTTSGPKCTCTAGFGGPNCDQILDGPEFKRCSATLQDLKYGNFTGTCGPPGRPDDYTYHTNKRDPTSITISMETVYVYPGDVPKKPTYLPESRVGNVESYALARLRYPSGAIVPGSEERLICDRRVKRDDPYAAAECRDVRYTWKHAIGHDYQMEINMYGVSGGYKILNNPKTSRRDTRYYGGTPANQTILINFDILDPHHCHTLPNTPDCTADIPPIFNEEFTKVPTVSLDFFGWDDKGTGLNLFSYRVHKMGLNSDGLLEISGESVHNGTQNVTEITEDNAVITHILPEPGRYSVVLTVSDRAGNTKNARTLVIYDNNNTLAQKPNTSVSLQGAVQGPYHYWLTSFNDNGPTQMVVTWEGVFHNPDHIAKHFLTGVELMDAGRDDGDPWGYDDKFGKLTTDPIEHIDGITSFKVGFGVDQNGGRTVLNHPPNLTEVALATEHRISYTVDDGHTVMLFVEAADCVGYNLTVATPVHVDSSPPIIRGNATFEKDYMSNSTDEMPYSSSLLVPAFDQHSGIGEVDYVITVASGPRANQKVGRHVAGNFRIQSARRKRDVTDDECLQTSKCICTNVGDCFPSPIPVDVNNCWFREYLDERLKIDFTVRNGALLSTPGTPVEFGPLVSVYGLHEYPSIKVFRADNITDVVISLRWVYPSSCHTPKGVIIKLGSDQHHVTYPQTTFVLSSQTPETTYTFIILVNYGDTQSGGRELKVTTDIKYPCPPGKTCGALGPGAIAGIVIGVLILILLILIAVFLLWRWRTHQPLVPERVRTMRNTFSNLRHTFMNKDVYNVGNHYQADAEAPNNKPKSMHVAYMAGLAGTEDDIYTYGDLETDPDASWKHSQDKLRMGEMLSTGRFAEVWKATLVDRTGQTPVAAKMLKAGSTSDDQLLMRAKMNFLATSVPVHENVVMLVGAVPTGDNPVILLEFCEMPLKTWLKDVKKSGVTDEAADNMINFTMHVGNGMQHLHEHHIMHRRLGVRNVLLKEVNGRYIAKLIGFGPMKNEVQEGNDEREKIPYKWMAPEQLGGQKGERRIYNEKTDVWTYGITLWEIFSCGEAPYKDRKHGEMKEVHKSGERLSRPEHCPEELYDDVMVPSWSRDPGDRPTFAEITEIEQKLFGSNHDGYYYADHDAEKGASNGGYSGKPDYGNNLYG